MTPVFIIVVILATLHIFWPEFVWLYKRYGAHLRRTRHPWVWGVSGYLVVAQVLDFVWPWHGWSLRLAVAVLFVACWWLTGRWVNRLERP